MVRKYVKARDIHDWTPLHYAAAAGRADNVRALIDLGADVNARDLMERTPLYYTCSWAVERRALSGTRVLEPVRYCINTLLRAGAEVNAQGRDETTPLHCAAMTGILDIPDSLERERTLTPGTHLGAHR